MCSIFSDVAGDITVIVDGESFLLHKVFHIINKTKNKNVYLVFSPLNELVLNKH